MNLTTVINTIKYLRKIIWLLSGDDMLGLLFHFLDELLFLMCADPYFIVKVSLRYFSFNHTITNGSGYIHTRWMVNGKTVRDAWHLQLDSNKRHSWHCLIICHKYHPLSYVHTVLHEGNFCASKNHTIRGDPGADSGNEVKVKNGEKSPWGQCLTRPDPNGCRRSGFWLVPENLCFSGTNQKPERWRPFGTGLVRHCPQGLFSPFFTFLRSIYISLPV